MEARIREAQTLSNVFVVDQPDLPQKPAFPNTPQMLLLGLLVSALAGVASVLFKEKLIALGEETTTPGGFVFKEAQWTEELPQPVSNGYSSNGHSNGNGNGNGHVKENGNGILAHH